MKRLRVAQALAAGVLGAGLIDSLAVISQQGGGLVVDVVHSTDREIDRLQKEADAMARILGKR